MACIFVSNEIFFVSFSDETIDKNYGKSSIKMLKLQCMECGEIFLNKSIPAIAFINTDITCLKCQNKKVTIRCNKCNGIIKCNSTYDDGRMKHKVKHDLDRISLLKYSCNGELICDTCGIKVDPNLVFMKYEQDFINDFVGNKIKGHRLFDIRSIRNKENNSTLMVFSDKYTGTDDLEYRTCMCKQHAKWLVLNEEEMEVYNHEFCGESMMLEYKEAKIKKKEKEKIK